MSPQEHEHDDWVRERVIERVAELGWTDSLVAQQAGVTLLLPHRRGGGA